MIVHHGGGWFINGDMRYDGGQVSLYDNLPDNVDASCVSTNHKELGLQ